MRLILCLPVQKGSWKLIFSQAENYLISYNISYNLQKRDTHDIGNVVRTRHSAYFMHHYCIYLFQCNHINYKYKVLSIESK